MARACVRACVRTGAREEDAVVDGADEEVQNVGEEEAALDPALADAELDGHVRQRVVLLFLLL